MKERFMLAVNHWINEPFFPFWKRFVLVCYAASRNRKKRLTLGAILSNKRTVGQIVTGKIWTDTPSPGA